MKLHITKEQLNEFLEVKSKENYNKKKYSNLYNLTCPNAVVCENFNIGKMIEILCNTDFCFPSIGLTESSKISEYIVVGVTCLSGSDKFRGKTFEADTLCDALWKAVKAVI